MPRKFASPSSEEDATIQRGIELNPDSPELGNDFFEDAHPAFEVLPPNSHVGLLAAEQANMERTTIKTQTMLGVDLDVLEWLQTSGPDWQPRANEALRQLIQR